MNKFLIGVGVFFIVVAIGAMQFVPENIAPAIVLLFFGVFDLLLGAFQ